MSMEWMRQSWLDTLALTADWMRSPDYREDVKRMAALNKRPPEMDSSLEGRFAKISKAGWADLYFDLYRQTCGDERASDEECMKDAERRLEILKTYRRSE